MHSIVTSQLKFYKLKKIYQLDKLHNHFTSPIDYHFLVQLTNSNQIFSYIITKIFS
jgi:hypothetical protein